MVDDQDRCGLVSVSSGTGSPGSSSSGSSSSSSNILGTNASFYIYDMQLTDRNVIAHF